LILAVQACVKALAKLGRHFPWPRPEICPGCHEHPLWGHGFVLAYFDEVAEPVWLRRYRCPLCRLVIRMKPAGYWPRFHATIAVIRESLQRRMKDRRWLPHLSRSRQRHWLRGLRIQILIHFGTSWSGDFLEAFDLLSRRGIVAASRSVCRASPATA
jgi:hypothetical protein